MARFELKHAGLSQLDQLACDTLVLWVFADQRPLRGLAGFVDWRLNGRLSALLKDDFFDGMRHEQMMTVTGGRIGVNRVVAMGAGFLRDLDLTAFSDLVDHTCQCLQRLKAPSAALSIPGWNREDQVYEDQHEMKLGIILDRLVMALDAPVTLFLPDGISLKEFQVTLNRIEQKLKRHG